MSACYSVIVAVGMALDAAGGNIQDTLLGMVFFGLGFVMTIVTGPTRIVAGVAARAHAASILVVDREAVSGNIDIAPARCIVALRALSSPMVWGRGMARPTVGLSLVVEIGGRPGAGVVAGGALPAKMVCRARMAGLAVGLPFMVEASR